MPDKDLKLIGKRIQQIRKNAGLTQERLAEKAWMHSKYIGQIERGEINTTLETLIKIAVALNMPISELLNLPGKNQQKELLIKNITDKLRQQKTETLILADKIIQAITK